MQNASIILRYSSTKIQIEATITKRILIVDEDDINFTLAVVLENNGFKVNSFADPLFALAHMI